MLQGIDKRNGCGTIPLLNLDHEAPSQSPSRTSIDGVAEQPLSDQNQSAELPIRQTLSIAVITQNEEANLARTLSSVQFADEIIVIDSGSTDRTLEIARNFGAKVFLEPWKGFAIQKNSAIEKCTGTWILSLDADEELSLELQQEIRKLLRGKPAADAYMIRRRNLFLKRWIRYGGYYPDPKLRLFRRHTANFAPPARFTERPVHETIAFDGTLDTLHHDLIHHAYPTIESYIEHMDRYSTLGAEIIVSKGKTSRSLWSFLYNVAIIPLFTFLWNFIFRFGFLDGREGFLLHLYHSTYTSWKYAKAWQTTLSED
ncbi:glycosyltransferase family 2 protein [Edaphobacter albus]|uniref:glycosyltransferase family 2 protein n=1 Tax=Edaphobacter sp. 4G125 TaxID=2763071 RepID=UPI0016453278|nr:glycosyltransferase family 2 protein [Edaphobacter sp. 4G125]QNI37909.1 glycosyltransferase family 2 protein [Edaphobacter sp. 4G125]